MTNFQSAADRAAAERAAELGFFPVDIDCAPESWELMAQTEHEGERSPVPALWMRHIPAVGDAIVFRYGAGTYRGTVLRRGFEAVLEDAPDFETSAYLYLDPVERCPDPTERSVWRTLSRRTQEANR